MPGFCCHSLHFASGFYDGLQGVAEGGRMVSPTRFDSPASSKIDVVFTHCAEDSRVKSLSVYGISLIYICRKNVKTAIARANPKAGKYSGFNNWTQGN